MPWSDNYVRSTPAHSRSKLVITIAYGSAASLTQSLPTSDRYRRYYRRVHTLIARIQSIIGMPKPASKVVSDKTRFGRYVFWAGLDQFAAQGFPRLVIFPLLAAHLGGSAFGSFVIALSLIQIIGNSPSNGLIAHVIRDAAKLGPAQLALLLRTTLMLCLALIGPVGIALALASSSIAGWYDQNQDLAVVLPGLVLFLVLANLTETLLSVQRVNRAFHLIAAVHGVQALGICLALPCVWYWGISGISIGYLVGGGGALVTSVIVSHKFFRSGGEQLLSATMAKSALATWLPFSASSFITLSAGYLDRVLLGYWWTPADVAPFFAAVSTAAIFGVPSAFLGNLILSLLGRVKSYRRFTRTFYVSYLAGIGLFSVATLGIGIILGRFILGVLYPKYVADASELWPLAITAFTLLIFQNLTRPFVCKFLAPRWLPVLAGVGLVARVLPLLLLVPTGGARGAVWALLIGCGITACLWVVTYIGGFLFGRFGVADGERPDHLAPRPCDGSEGGDVREIQVSVVLTGREGAGVRQFVLSQRQAAAEHGVSFTYICLEQRELCTELRTLGESVSICGGSAPRPSRLGPAVSYARWFLPGGGFWRSLRGLHRCVMEQKVDVLYSHAPHMHVVCGIVAKLTGCAAVGQVHGPLNIRRIFGLNRLLYCTALALLLDRIITISAYARGTLLGIAKRKSVMIYNGADFESIRDMVTPPTERRRVLTVVGRLVPWKQLEQAVRAIHILRQRIPDLTVEFLGGPADETNRYFVRLKELAESLGIAHRVRFCGVVSPPFAPVASSSIFVSCASTEGFGYAVLEAVACGTPVIVADRGAPAEIIIDGQTGLHYKADDPASLAERIATLLGDAPLARRLADRAWNDVRERFTIQKHMAKMRTAMLEGIAAA